MAGKWVSCARSKGQRKRVEGIDKRSTVGGMVDVRGVLEETEEERFGFNRLLYKEVCPV